MTLGVSVLMGYLFYGLRYGSGLWRFFGGGL